MTRIATKNKRSLVAAELASGKSITEVGQQFGLSRSTIHRRLREPDFARLVTELRDAAVATALGSMTTQMEAAARTLVQAMSSEKESLRIRAARTLLTVGMKLRDSVDLNERLREVERDLQQREVPHGHA